MENSKLCNTFKRVDRRAKRTKITYIRYFWGPIPWVWFGVIRCTLQNFQFHDFRNTTPSTVFIRFQPNLIQSIIIGLAVSFLAIYQKLKILWHFEIFLNAGAYGAGNFKTLLLLQFSSDGSQTLWGHWATIVEYRLSLSLAIGEVLKICGTLKF